LFSSLQAFTIAYLGFHPHSVFSNEARCHIKTVHKMIKAGEVGRDLHPCPIWLAAEESALTKEAR